jgi:hypothetical protein
MADSCPQQTAVFTELDSSLKATAVFCAKGLNPALDTVYPSSLGGLLGG